MTKNKPLLTLVLLVLTALMAMPNNAFAALSNPPKNPYEFIRDRPSGNSPTTLDAALSFDSASMELIYDVYEPLITWEGEPYDILVAILATQAWIAPPDPTAPVYTNYTIYFKIRTGVPFHNRCRVDEPFSWNQYYLTTEDVEYSFEREIVHDYVGGPQYYLIEPLLRTLATDPEDPTFGDKIDNAIQRNGTHVWLNIANKDLAASSPVPFAPVELFTEDGYMRPTFWDDVSTLPTGFPLKIILQVLAQTFGCVFSKEWILNFVIPWGVDHGVDMNPDVDGIQFEWDGDFANWTDYCKWGNSPLDRVGELKPGVTCGTGPYLLDRYDPTADGEWSAIKYDLYWGAWPCPYPSPPYTPRQSSGIKPAGWVERVTVRCRTVPTMTSELITGDCDWAYVEPPQYPSVHVGGDPYGPTLPGIRLDYPVFRFIIGGFNPVFNVSATPDDKWGKIYPTNELHEDGIPCNFFSDVHVRKAFYYLINYSMVIDEAYMGEAYQPVTCVPTGLAYVNTAQEHYTLDTAKAISEFDQAFGGNLKNIGFTVRIYWYSGGAWAKATNDDLAARINALGVSNYGGKFHCSSNEVIAQEEWPAMQNFWMPAFASMWAVDYADIHNMIAPYMHSQAFWLVFQNYANATIDALINQGIDVPDGPMRQSVYYQLQEIYFQEAISSPVIVPVYRRYSRTWLSGRYYHSLYGSTMIWARNLWKWEYIRGNVNYDNKVSMDDIIALLDGFGSYYGKSGIPVVHPKWNFNLDVDGNPADSWRDRKIDMYDITVALGNFGNTQTIWTPP